MRSPARVAPSAAGWLMGALLALLTLLAVASPARAHAELESSDPADGATLTAPPASVSFTFGEELLEQGNAIVVTELGTGTRLTTGPVQVDRDVVSVAWPDDSAAGEYRAAFRVVSADGHPIEGTITFTVSSGSGSTPAESSPAPTQSATPLASPAVDPDASAAADSDEGGVSQAAWILGIGLVVLLGALGGAWYLRRTR